MTLSLPDLPGHEGRAAALFAEGASAPAGYQAVCSCGWTDRRRYPATPEGVEGAEYQWWSRHVPPLLAAAPPKELVIKSNVLGEQIMKLAGERPVAAVALLARMERWQRVLLDQAVDRARESGASWSEVGDAMGISKQAAHERFRRG
ncbi:hypothetical protein EDD29_5855 [Actinocorallia herbida]|uniref:Homeodomain-like domain-containing protein n=1 Tax=Actinocorallia herbida TaxID=58109 RepID=A0A3N1D3T1_9ACTN|nr:hypothetical protein [Actinocorallia herbida]ROO88193.1 hypothetical protein EDD29_5855 [Actinocorallia herbida]